MGIEPTFLAWEATFLPLEDTRDRVDFRGLPTVVANDASYSGTVTAAVPTSSKSSLNTTPHPQLHAMVAARVFSLI
jgi:hypothetical protein